MKFSHLVLATCCVLFSLPVFAENGPKGNGVSLFVGPVLPKNISATDEILHAWGMRYSMERSAGSFWEFGFTISNTDKSEFRDYSASIRADIPVQDLTAFFLGGPQLTSFQGTYYGGVHLGGGIITHLTESSFFRVEMRSNFHPGTALLFSFGFEIHF